MANENISEPLSFQEEKIKKLRSKFINKAVDEGLQQVESGQFTPEGLLSQLTQTAQSKQQQQFAGQAPAQLLQQLMQMQLPTGEKKGLKSGLDDLFGGRGFTTGDPKTEPIQLAQAIQLGNFLQKQTPQQEFLSGQKQKAQEAGVVSSGNPTLDTIIKLTNEKIDKREINLSAEKKTAALQAQKEFDVEQGQQQLEVFSEQFERAIEEIEAFDPEALDTGIGGFIARAGLKISSSKLFDELPELAALRDNIEATATPLAKLAGEDRLTNEDIERFLKTLFDPTKRSLESNLSKVRFQMSKLRKNGKNTDVLQAMTDRLDGKVSLRKATKRADASGGRLAVMFDGENRALVDTKTGKIVREF